jgi:tetraacyldisaccharide 4'-kinase
MRSNAQPRRPPSDGVSLTEQIWYGRGITTSTARAALWPFAQAYGVAVATRGWLYDAGILRRETPALPTISVGNLTVGGTGKTPFAAWLASELAVEKGAWPAVVLRGYGTDEIAVHRRLNPNLVVIANADRAAAIRDARSRDANVVVLDDAFQHRRIRRAADIVLLSAEQLLRPRRLLPAGPWRQPLRAARMADLIVVTRKSASAAESERATNVVREVIADVPIVVAYLMPDQLRSATDDTSLAVDKLRGASVTAIAAIGEPSLFARQLEQLGARVSLVAHRDHHRYTDADIAAAAALVDEDGFAVCTLKDAVKLAGRWPRRSRLWYVSQRLVVEKGAEDLKRLLERVLDARATTAITAG